MHLLNHVGHFPMAIGAARLSSMVVEHDDVPGLSPDELSAQVFSAPNIQVCFFVMSLAISSRSRAMSSVHFVNHVFPSCYVAFSAQLSEAVVPC